MGRAIGPRIQVVNNPLGITAYIKTRRRVFPYFFLPVWLAFWTLGGITAISLIATGQASPFLFLWLCGWLVGEVFATVSWLWNAFGREVVEIAGGSFVYRRELLGYSLTRKGYPVNSLSNLRASGFFSNFGSYNFSMAQWGFTGGTAAVDQGYTTIRFGNGLEETEANALAEALQPHIPNAVSGS
jgi:hypothetical protein